MEGAYTCFILHPLGWTESHGQSQGRPRALRPAKVLWDQLLVMSGKLYDKTIGRLSHVSHLWSQWLTPSLLLLDNSTPLLSKNACLSSSYAVCWVLPPILKHEASPVSGLCVFLFVLPPSCAIPWNTQVCPSLLPWLPKSSHPEQTYFLRLRPDSPIAWSRGCPAFLCKSLGSQPEIVPSQLRPTFQSLRSFQSQQYPYLGTAKQAGNPLYYQNSKTVSPSFWSFPVLPALWLLVFTSDLWSSGPH